MEGLKSVSLAPESVPTFHPDEVPKRAAVQVPERKERKKPEQSKEEAEAAIAEFKGILFGNKPVVPGAKKEEVKEEPAKEEAAPEPEPKVEEKPAPAKSKVKVTKRAKRDPINEEEVEAIVAKTTARATAEALRVAEEQKKKTTAAEEHSFLTDADKRRLENLKELESSNDRYVGVTKQFVAYKQKEAHYRDKWAKENPGVDFDPEADEHEDFYAKHSPDIDQDDYTEAVASAKAKKLIEKEREKLSAKHDEMERKITDRELEPVLINRANQALVEMLGGVDEDLAKLFTEKGGAAVAEENPLAFEVLDNLAKPMQKMVYELSKISNPRARYGFDPKNQVHVELDKWVTGKFEEFAEEERDGKPFVQYSEFIRLPALQQRKAWTVAPEDLVEVLVQDFAAEAKAIIADREAKMESYIKRKSGASKATGGEKGAAVEKPAPAAPKHTSPAGQGGGVSQPKLEATATQQKTLGKEIRSLLFND